METNEVSLHRLYVWKYVEKSGCWLTNDEIAKGANVALRTARSHSKALSDLGLFDRAEIFPAHRFKMSDKAAARNQGYLQRLQQAAEVVGLEF